MKELDEETALSILFGNTKRKKRDADLLTIAQSCDYLVKLYGSQKAVADKIGLSSEMVREFLTTLRLPTEVQEIIAERKIDRVDVVREISVLKSVSKQIAVAKALADAPSKDIRDIKRLLRSGVSIEDASKLVLDSRPKGLNVFVMDFDDVTYQALFKKARTLKTTPAELARRIILEWLQQNANQ